MGLLQNISAHPADEQCLACIESPKQSSLALQFLVPEHSCLLRKPAINACCKFMNASPQRTLHVLICIPAVLAEAAESVPAKACAALIARAININAALWASDAG